MTDLVDEAQRASFVLSNTTSAKLRKMTRASGLSSDNIVSRIAIVRSLEYPLPVLRSDPGLNSGGKEIKGLTLLGRRRPAALLVAMIAKHAGNVGDVEELKTLIRFHWDRGIQILSEDCPDGDVTHWFARQLSASDGREGSERATRALVASKPKTRDSIAASVGRRYGRWPLEVRRLAALAGRLNEHEAQAAADRLAERCAELSPNTRVHEALVLQVFKEWGLNRLGLNDADRRLLQRLAEAEAESLEPEAISLSERSSVEFLTQLKLVSVGPKGIRLSSAAKRLGAELWAA